MTKIYIILSFNGSSFNMNNVPELDNYKGETELIYSSKY